MISRRRQSKPRTQHDAPRTSPKFTGGARVDAHDLALLHRHAFEVRESLDAVRSTVNPRGRNAGLLGLACTLLDTSLEVLARYSKRVEP